MGIYVRTYVPTYTYVQGLYLQGCVSQINLERQTENDIHTYIHTYIHVAAAAETTNSDSCRRAVTYTNTLHTYVHTYAHVLKSVCALSYVCSHTM